ncbi:DUF6597 domain-containing transcriptional factor [Actinomadura viridis]|uniref:DUF6597 domain-containing transcriptional factor n=1 Tax=Actinomadura viridis TaxID=58110 RepID=UPI00367957D9
MNAARYDEFAAPPRTGLACVWTRAVPDAPYVQPVVPDGCVDLVWWSRGARIVVAGPDTRPSPTRMEAGDRLVGVRFLPGTAPPVLGVPADAVRDARVPLRELWGAEADRLGEAVARAHDPRAVLTEAVLGRAPAAPDPFVPALSAALESLTVAEAAEELGLSGRQLRRRSLAAFGYGPKTLQRVLRFQRALGLARAGRPLADVAHATGYSDQAHMAHEVRGLSGVPIRALL